MEHDPIIPTYATFDLTALESLVTHLKAIVSSGEANRFQASTAVVEDADGEEQAVAVRWAEGRPRIAVAANPTDAPKF